MVIEIKGVFVCLAGINTLFNSQNFLRLKRQLLKVVKLFIYPIYKAIEIDK